MDPLRPTGQDVVGIVFRVPLVDGGDQLAYILHRGDTKDPGPDQFLVSANYGHEVWRLQGRRPGEALDGANQAVKDDRLTRVSTRDRFQFGAHVRIPVGLVASRVLKYPP